METYHHHQQQEQMNIEKGIEEREENKQNQPIIISSPQISQASNSSSSLSSSPSHEFTFTISLHNSTYNSSVSKFINNDEENSKDPPNNHNHNPLAVDLSPADEIFFHGHLLPLQLLSHLPQSPSRSSTNSMDSFTLPIRELLEDDETHKENGSCSTSNRSNITIDNSNKNRGNRENRDENRDGSDNNTERKNEGKSNNFAFSLFGFKKGLKGSKVRYMEEKENHHNKKKKVRFDVIHVLKKYLKMVKPMVFFKGKREKFRINGKSSYSYSGNVTPRNNSNSNNDSSNKKKEFIRGWRGEYYSAPASMRTSPTNSGVLVATNNAMMIPSASDSTMEELQAAIQAAIVHCKNSFAKEEKLKC